MYGNLLDLTDHFPPHYFTKRKIPLLIKAMGFTSRILCIFELKLKFIRIVSNIN
ncbi:hypothetical protein SAMN05444387_0335 [Flavobacterium pectinovorum]|uniref:Uncharacterized protein n=1 Tax=Flavobacterium pectinovorum TaxID=29533 RepID=A0ABY1IXP1_9FLAO|nr:hypothetical protein SAMN05444387_0335 [Flavobacterium pectinovorum]